MGFGSDIKMLFLEVFETPATDERSVVWIEIMRAARDGTEEPIKAMRT